MKRLWIETLCGMLLLLALAGFTQAYTHPVDLNDVLAATR